ncbi:MAG: hypothetical protein LBI02_07660 [Opitutaceae bacterium]|nr:hypothetical protein [Opitutaceae bacterium]
MPVIDNHGGKPKLLLPCGVLFNVFNIKLKPVRAAGTARREKSAGMENSTKAIQMKIKIEIRSMFMGVVLGVAAVLSVGAITGAGRTAWEYKVVAGSAYHLEGKLNDAVSQGWEFVSASGCGVDKGDYVYGLAVLKRESPERLRKAIQGK